MGNYSEPSFSIGFIPYREIRDTRVLDHAVEMILKTAGTIERSNEAVVSTWRVQQRIYGCIRDLRSINEDILRVVKKTNALLRAPHNVESWADAFARVQKTEVSPPSSGRQRPSSIAAIQSHQPWRQAQIED